MQISDVYKNLLGNSLEKYVFGQDIGSNNFDCLFFFLVLNGKLLVYYISPWVFTRIFCTWIAGMYNNILIEYYLIFKIYYFHYNTSVYCINKNRYVTIQRPLNVLSKLHLIMFNILFTISVTFNYSSTYSRVMSLL